MEDFTTLQVVWFVLISVLWIGYFILEGFDFGVGILFKGLGRSQGERRAILHTIGPVWDGNEVWLIVAGGATFAAFPEWYATLFSGFYLALFAILVALIVRAVGFELWGKRDGARWRNGWEWAIALGSAVPALLWGVAWANIVDGTPIDSDGEFVGSFFDLLRPYTVLGGLATLALFFTHGALFLEMKTTGELRERAARVAARSAPVAVIFPAAFLVWSLLELESLDVGGLLFSVAAVAALLFAAATVKSRPVRAFTGTAIAIASMFTALFIELFPHTMISSLDPAFSMTLNQSASTEYTLTVMTVVAALLLPVTLLYQAWTYWVFRRRVGPEDFGEVKTPLDLLDEKKRKAEDVDRGSIGSEPAAGSE